MNNSTVLILDNIRSVHNVGSLFRTADGMGISNIILCGTTPTPEDRFGRERKDFAKVSLGAEKTISWNFFEKTQEAILKFKSEGYEIVALEQDSKSTDLHEYSRKEKVALVLGPEVTGMSQDVLEMCDVVVEISMRGMKESLNVSVAGGIAMYEITKKI